MTGNEIKQKIEENNRKIEFLLTPSMFTLNNEVSILLKENENLQKSCDHSFENGFCIYCYKGER